MNQSEPTFSEFYAGYLAHHRHPANRALHMLAKLLAIAGLVAAVHERSVVILLAVPVLAVAPCWLGHLWFEGNRPVSWNQPSASLLGTLAAACGMGRTRRDGGAAGEGRGQLGLPTGDGRPLQAEPPPTPRTPETPAGGRAYYSFLADLRMCGEMLTGKGAARSSSEST
jgi:hypothetical protein